MSYLPAVAHHMIDASFYTKSKDENHKDIQVIKIDGHFKCECGREYATLSKHEQTTAQCIPPEPPKETPKVDDGLVRTVTLVALLFCVAVAWIVHRVK